MLVQRYKNISNWSSEQFDMLGSVLLFNGTFSYTIASFPEESSEKQSSTGPNHLLIFKK